MQAVVKWQHIEPATNPSPSPTAPNTAPHVHHEQKGSSSEEEKGEIVGILEVSSLAAFKKGTNGHYPSCFQLLSLPLPSQEVTLEQLNDLSFPVLSQPLASLIHSAQLLLCSSPARQSLSLGFDLPLLLRQLALNYGPTAYHNFSHAFSVLLLLHQSYTRSPQLREVLTQSQWFFAFLAALAHDLGHPATTNNFQIRKNTPAAILSNNESVLEQLHLRTFWQILRDHPSADPLTSHPQSHKMRQLITRLILATDIAKHFQGLQALRTVVGASFPLSEEQSLCVAEQIFHGCDIGNPCLDYQSYLNWAALVAYQFDELAGREAREGMQVTGYLKYTGLEGFYEKQAGFCANLVLPLWVQLDALLHLGEMRANVESNMKLLAQDQRRQKEKHEKHSQKQEERANQPSELKQEAAHQAKQGKEKTLPLQN